MAAEASLWIGHPFAFDVAVRGAIAGDAFAVNVARTASGAEIDIAWTGPADTDGIVRVRLNGPETAALKPGSYRAELMLRRGGMSGILGPLLTISAQKALGAPMVGAPAPLVSNLGRALKVTIDEPQPVPVQLVAGIKGDNGASGDAFEHIQSAPATTWTIAHNLHRRPSVTTLSVGGLPIEGAVHHLSADVLTVTFLVPVAGSAHLV